MPQRASTGEAAPIAVRITAVMLLAMAAWIAFDLHGTLGDLAGRPNADADSIRLDPRTATAAELELVPGIGPATAARIVEHRRRHGREALIERSEDGGSRWRLDVVSGVGPVTARRAAPYLQHPSFGVDHARDDAEGATR